MTIEVRRKNFKTKMGAISYRLLSTGDEKTIRMNLGAFTAHFKSFDSHPNCEIFLIEVPHGYVKKVKDFLKRRSETND